eukprot:5245806-Karenia_brevis.AAC.1
MGGKSYSRNCNNGPLAMKRCCYILFQNGLIRIQCLFFTRRRHGTGLNCKVVTSASTTHVTIRLHYLQFSACLLYTSDAADDM